MVKSVVKSFLPKHTAAEKRENARKTEILRAFGGRLMRRSHAPKCGALSTALHPDSLFNCGRVSGQICGQKFFAEAATCRDAPYTVRPRMTVIFYHTTPILSTPYSLPRLFFTVFHFSIYRKFVKLTIFRKTIDIRFFLHIIIISFQTNYICSERSFGIGA